MLDDIAIVSNVFPFKTNSYVIEELINWDQPINDPIFNLVFPKKGMLLEHHYRMMKQGMDIFSAKELNNLSNSIRSELNPQPAGQKTLNTPILNGERLNGVQHKYKETVLFFPKNSQTCHAYCTFCFRWPQFVNMKDQKFASKEVDKLIEYLQIHPEVSDLLFTGGDPMVMKARVFEKYINPILEADIPHLRTIRIGSKSLSYWPSRYTTDKDADHMLQIFSTINQKHNLAFMAHFNHYQELQTQSLEEAVTNIRKTGTQIRTQSPILNHINADHRVWKKMWKMQVDLGMIPYYMFLVRDTGAQHYFGVTLLNAWRIFNRAYREVSGIARTVRGPSMSCTPGKILFSGPAKIGNEDVMVLKFIQGRDASWVNKPFFAKYNPNAIWIDDLEPVFEDSFFFEDQEIQFQEEDFATTFPVLDESVNY
ncbi:MAG: 4Fe-4S cluster-binding domain-containing protein [Candidatus Heimdallarchaeota archaeon]|nr:4Fe-4S cluster-binding domain-containing protein [Candidatus Heimdallarchaeota archaeon]MDH5645797.1 4Fe-4S cluster-binding domain-containing protein [Candidatus Heimdallarchaeota archaeon]